MAQTPTPPGGDLKVPNVSTWGGGTLQRRVNGKLHMYVGPTVDLALLLPHALPSVTTPRTSRTEVSPAGGWFIMDIPARIVDGCHPPMWKYLRITPRFTAFCALMVETT